MTDVIIDLRPTEEDDIPWLRYLIAALCGGLLGASGTALIALTHLTGGPVP